MSPPQTHDGRVNPHDCRVTLRHARIFQRAIIPPRGCLDTKFCIEKRLSITHITVAVTLRVVLHLVGVSVSEDL